MHEVQICTIFIHIFYPSISCWSDCFCKMMFHVCPIGSSVPFQSWSRRTKRLSLSRSLSKIWTVPGGDATVGERVSHHNSSHMQTIPSGKRRGWQGSWPHASDTTPRTRAVEARTWCIFLQLGWLNWINVANFGTFYTWCWIASPIIWNLIGVWLQVLMFSIATTWFWKLNSVLADWLVDTFSCSDDTNW